MSNSLAILDNAPSIPANVAEFFDDTDNSNLRPRETVPSLSYEGKTWTISLNGERKPLMRKNAEGDEEPLAVMRVIVLDYAARRGRAFYEGAYDPAKPMMPVCWSDDGIAPSSYVKAKKADACAKCPLSVKGSKVTEQGKAVTACGEHRMIVVIPAGRLDFEPLRMKLAITSDYDGQSPDMEAQGWFGFKNYTDMLRTKQVKHTAMLVTKMRFDPSVAYPKVLFSADKWLDAEALAQIPAIVKDERVAKLVSGSWTPDGVDGRPVEQLEKPQTAAPAPVAAKPVMAPPKATPVPTAQSVEEEAVMAGDEDEGDAILPETKPAAPVKSATKAAPKKAAAKANGAAIPAAQPSADDLNQLLADWS